MNRLTIAILSMPQRSAFLARLLNHLSPQLRDGVEVLIAIDVKGTRWQKRNQLLAAASGAYIAYLDDDDDIAANYIDALYGALATDPDCVTFLGKRFSDGKYIGINSYSLGNSEYRTEKKPVEWVWHRPPNHFCPVRIDLARWVEFRDEEMEDIDYALRLHPLLKTSVHIDEQLHEYHYLSPMNRQ